MSDASSPRDLRLELILTDSRAIEIVENLPIERRNEIIERYIILGEMVVSHASISTRRQAVEDFFAPIRSDIEMIQEQLSRVVPTLATPAKKGEVTEESIFQSLQEHFMDDSFENVSKTGKYTDILATTHGTNVPVLIELKDYKRTVPSDEVSKFWRDMGIRGTKWGIFVSMRSNIAKCSGAISIRTEMNKTGIFVVNCDLNWMGHIFAYYIIKKIAGLERMQKDELTGEELSKVIARVNDHVIDLQKQVESIDNIQEIAVKLKATCRKRLDELIDTSNGLKRVFVDKIRDLLHEIEQARV
jgi:hypothetical protein